MKNSNMAANVSFRFNDLNKLQAFTLVREVMEASYEEVLSSNSYVGLVALTEHNLDDINDFYVRQRVDVSQCDIFVSSEKTTQEIAVPNVVNRMLKYIDCRLTCAFTQV